MIVAERKSLEEILESIKKYNKILILGCRGCVNVCSVGGEKEVSKLAEEIKLAREEEGRPIEILEKTLIRQCEVKYLEPLEEFKDKVEAVISLGCGVGINLIADLYPEIRIYPGVNTTFYGAKVEKGHWIEKCKGCGDCIIDKTAGLCPITRCAKNLLNGPCGGSQNGKCEIREDLPCVWHQIIERLKKRGELEKLAEIWEPRDWRLAGGEGVREKIKK